MGITSGDSARSGQINISKFLSSLQVAPTLADPLAALASRRGPDGDPTTVGQRGVEHRKHRCHAARNVIQSGFTVRMVHQLPP